MPRLDKTLPEHDVGDFERASSSALDRLRLALARLLQELPGSASRATDLRRALSLDAALAWQVHTLATSRGRDILGAGRVVPKVGAMERFLKAAGAVGLPDHAVSEARAAYEAFERTVGDHAGDRATFEAMLSAIHPADGASLRKIRRNAYRANTAVWGVAIRAHVNCVVFRQRPTGEHDALAVRGRVGLHRLRENAVVGFPASGRTWGGGTSPPEGEPTVTVGRCELLEDHCSRPIPRIRRVEPAGPAGKPFDFLEPQGLGLTSTATLLYRNLSLDFPGGSATPPHGTTVYCREPAEVLIADLLIPRGWAEPGTAAATIVDDSRNAIEAPSDPQHFPFEGVVEHLGQNLERLYTRHAPSYAEAVAGELEALGWTDTEFDLYRCEIPYPILHSALHLSVG